MPNLYFKDTGYYLKREDDIYGPKHSSYEPRVCRDS